MALKCIDLARKMANDEGTYIDVDLIKECFPLLVERFGNLGMHVILQIIEDCDLNEEDAFVQLNALKDEMMDVSGDLGEGNLVQDCSRKDPDNFSSCGGSISSAALCNPEVEANINNESSFCNDVMDSDMNMDTYEKEKEGRLVKRVKLDPDRYLNCKWDLFNTKEDEFDSSDHQKSNIFPPIDIILAQKSMEELLNDHIEIPLLDESDDEGEDSDMFYFVKFKGKSYIHNQWVRQSDIKYELSVKGTNIGKVKLNNFLKKEREGTTEYQITGDYFNPDFIQVDRILDVKQRKNQETMCLIKWKSLSYSESTWENLQYLNSLDNQDVLLTTKLEAFHRYSTVPSKEKILEMKKKMQMYDRENRNVSDMNNLSIMECTTTGLSLRDYQVEGVKWLLHNWENNRNCILADEMGLGKTAQTIVFLDEIRKRYDSWNPFLIVAPLSTLSHWYREWTTWSDLNVVVLHGNNISRYMVWEHEIFYKEHTSSNPLPYKVDVIITTCEVLLSDFRAKLEKIEWGVVVTDEGHRLKSGTSRSLAALEKLSCYGKLLLTGTPIQNNVEELFHLLHYLNPHLPGFQSKEQWMQAFGSLTAQSIRMLHEIVRPVILRRVKSDVCKELVPLDETLIFVQLTPFQKRCYKAIYERNNVILLQGCNSTNKPSLINIQMELRKCCSHPFLVDGVEEGELMKLSPKDHFTTKEIIAYSGKLTLLTKLLPKLQLEGHRVLLFSQFKIVLNYVEDLLLEYNYKYERIDGSIHGSRREQAIDRFNKITTGPDAPFIFILSTRAGGVGINLQTADTVILFDSDWNPQMDLQAQARCHRIGQKKEVKVYRLLSSKTYETEIFRRANMKLGLEQAIHAGDQKTGNQTKSSSGTNEETLYDPPNDLKEIDDLLRRGVYDLQDNEEENASSLDENIDSILANSTVSRKKIGSASSGGYFSIAKFTYNQEHDGNSTSPTPTLSPDLNDPKFWEKLLGTTLNELNEKQELGPRRRNPRYPSNVVGYSSRKNNNNTENPEECIYTDSSTDTDCEEVEPGFLSLYRLKILKRTLLIYGLGRWDLVQEAAGLKDISLPVILSYAREMLNVCFQGYSDDLIKGQRLKDQLYPLVHFTQDNTIPIVGKHTSTPTPIGVGKHTSTPTPIGVGKHTSTPIGVSHTKEYSTCGLITVSLDESFVCNLYEKGTKIIHRLWLLMILGESIHRAIARNQDTEKEQKNRVEGDILLTTSFRSPKLNRKILEAPRWHENRDQDSYLLLGIYKYGWKVGNSQDNFQEIFQDPSFPFYSRINLQEENHQCNPILPSTLKLNTRIQQLIKLLYSNHIKSTRISMDKKLREEELQKKRYEKELVRSQMEKARIQRIQEAQDKREKAKQVQVALQNAKTVKSHIWSKKERNSFWKAYTNFGAPFHDKSKMLDWSVMKTRTGKYGLGQKTEEQIGFYYLMLCRHCYEITGDILFKNEGCESTTIPVQYNTSGDLLFSEEDAQSDVDEIFATHFLQILRMRSKINNTLLGLSINELKCLCQKMKKNDENQPKEVPIWWKSGQDDLALVLGCKKYGLGDSSWGLIWSDANFGFSNRMESEPQVKTDTARGISFFPKPYVCIKMLQHICSSV